MRQIILDTETTGIGHETGHRIIEIGCVELVDRKLTNRHFHTYLNPQREIDEGAFRVHGISSEFLQDKPLFKTVLDEFLDFVTGAELVIHNAPFDIGFINAELKRASVPFQIESRCTVFDTLVFAKEKHPGQRNNLDALCKRYQIDNTNRTLHGALLDAEILALVYLAMTGGQTNLFEENIVQTNKKNEISHKKIESLSSNSPILAATKEEQSSHDEFIQFIVKKSGINLWQEDENPPL